MAAAASSLDPRVTQFGGTNTVVVIVARSVVSFIEEESSDSSDGGMRVVGASFESFFVGEKRSGTVEEVRSAAASSPVEASSVVEFRGGGYSVESKDRLTNSYSTPVVVGAKLWSGSEEGISLVALASEVAD